MTEQPAEREWSVVEGSPLAQLVVPAWLEESVRWAMGALVVVPGVSKFLTYGHSVAFFENLGIPAASVLVLGVGVVEVGAAAGLFLDRYATLAGLSLVPVMAVAIATAGATWSPVVVLLGGLSLPLLAVPEPDQAERDANRERPGDGEVGA